MSRASSRAWAAHKACGDYGTPRMGHTALNHKEVEVIRPHPPRTDAVGTSQRPPLVCGTSRYKTGIKTWPSTYVIYVGDLQC